MTATLPKAHADLQAAIMTAIKGLANFNPTEITGEPDVADAENLRFDLLALCEVVDPLFSAIGEYADRHFGISRKDLALFANVSRAAIDGNAEYILHKIAADMRAAADLNRSIRRLVSQGVPPSHIGG